VYIINIWLSATATFYEPSSLFSFFLPPPLRFQWVQNIPDTTENSRSLIDIARSKLQLLGSIVSSIKTFLNNGRMQYPELKRYWQKKTVCSLHFRDYQIQWDHVVKTPAGTVTEKTRRERPILVEGATPTVFPNLDPKFTKPDKKRKPPRALIAPKIKKNDNQCDGMAVEVGIRRQRHFNTVESCYINIRVHYPVSSVLFWSRLIRQRLESSIDLPWCRSKVRLM